MPYALPRRHRYAHDYAIFLHDIIVHLVKVGHEDGVFSVALDLSLTEERQLESLENGELYDWLEQRKGRGFTAQLDYRLLTAAILSDFCHFTFEGLRAASRGKLTVAYALFRKPFKDNLFFLEWLLADQADLLARLTHGSPQSLDPAGLEPDRRLEITRMAMELVAAPGVTFARLRQARYDRISTSGLADAWDKSLHLVTTWRRSRTEPRNLNFIFSGPKEWETQWPNLYWMIPFLLYYTTFVVHAIVDRLAPLDDRYMDEIHLRRAIGYELWSEYTRHEEHQRGFHASLNDLLEDLTLRCQSCGAALPPHRTNLKAIVLRGTIRCRRCGDSTSLRLLRGKVP